MPRWRLRTTLRGAAKRVTDASGLERAVKDYFHHLPSSLYVATVVASIVHLFNSAELPLELPATMLLASVAEIYVPAPASRNDVRRHLAVVEIDQDHHQKHYGGTSPLNRCRLKSDLMTLLANPQLRVLAIDFDLSPVDAAGYQEAWKGLGELAAAKTDKSREARCKPMKSELQRCQCELESVLESDTHRGRIIAITPLTSTEGRMPGQPWANNVDFPGVSFGNPDFTTRFGMVHDYEYPPPGYVGARPFPLAELIARRLCAEDKLPSYKPEGCRDIPRELPAAASSEGTDENKRFKKEAISFFEVRYLHKGGRPLAMDDACLKKALPDGAGADQAPCDIRFIILGGSYGIEDRNLTPLGHKTGVQIHAAIAGQMRARAWHGVGFLWDIALGGLIFGPFVHYMWRQYFLQRAQVTRARSAWRHPRVAYLWLLGLGVGLLVLVAILVYGSAEMYASKGVWISPVPMALGMLLEAVVSGSVHVANHVIRDVHTTAYGNLTPPEPAKRAAVVLGHLPRAAALGLILYVVFGLIHH